jgi:hypothetical protein
MKTIDNGWTKALEEKDRRIKELEDRFAYIDSEDFREKVATYFTLAIVRGKIGIIDPMKGNEHYKFADKVRELIKKGEK